MTHLVIRRIPDFEFFKTVTIGGEVKYPGAYPLLSKDEKILSVIERAGGVTNEAFLQGARLYRADESEKGFILLKLEKNIKRQKTKTTI